MRDMRWVRGSVIVLILWLAASCSTPVAVEPAPPGSTGALEEPAPTGEPRESATLEPNPPTVERETVPSAPPTPTTEERDGEAGEAIPEELLAVIRRLTAAQHAVAEDEIAVERVEAVEWPDASLGCPEPGVMYAQVVTPGYRVELSAGGETVWVHTDAGRQVVVCGEDGHPVLPAIPVDPGEILDGEPWIPVDG